MSLPAAIWPYLWGLCAFLALVSWLTSQAGPTKALLSILAAYLAVRVSSMVFGGEGIYLAIGALIWAATAMAVYRAGFATVSCIIAASALCYYWAAFVGAPRVVGSVPFVTSDVLMVVAMVWIGSDGLAILSSRIVHLGGSGIRHSDAASAHSLEENEEKPSKIAPYRNL